MAYFYYYNFVKQCNTLDHTKTANKTSQFNYNFNRIVKAIQLKKENYHSIAIKTQLPSLSLISCLVAEALCLWSFDIVNLSQQNHLKVPWLKVETLILETSSKLFWMSDWKCKIISFPKRFVLWSNNESQHAEMPSRKSNLSHLCNGAKSSF